MRNTIQRHAIVLAALLQVLPIVRNFFANPAAISNFAFILRWGVGTIATVGAFDACSGATNSFTSPGTFSGTVGTFFTNNLTLQFSGTNGNVITTISSNTVSVALTTSGQTTNFAMPPGLNFRYIDDKSLTNGVYDSIFGTPTSVGTNTFTITMNYAGQKVVQTNITIRILALSSVPPVITNQPSGSTNVAGGTVSFTVVAGGSPAVNYQWRLDSGALTGATNATLTFTNVRASQVGSYTVFVTNTAGAVTSSPALLMVTNPSPPTATANALAGGQFNLIFNPVPGLTNTVQTNGDLTSGTWAAFTNIPPPANNNPISLTNQSNLPRLFYRLIVIP